LAALGRLVLGGLAAVGRVAIFAADTVIGHLLRPPFYLREFGIRSCRSAGSACPSSA
jgi:phospholipid/cholesterol/gamma-HCH transport system permease protein